MPPAIYESLISRLPLLVSSFDLNTHNGINRVGRCQRTTLSTFGKQGRTLAALAIYKMTNFRVRALAITPNNKLLFIKRIKGNTVPYWIFVGGGVEDTDTNFVKALERELLEEANAKGEILYPVHYTEQEWEGKKRFDIYYLVHLHTWSEVGRMGEEFLNPENGLYLLDEVAIEALEHIKLYPEEVKTFLINNQHYLLHLPQIPISHIL